ncbi:MAG: glycoside hydrolase family 9 protein [Lachnospiraceae bacterium]|nr:glycoside hydrolase family 9 protein [Lachnospiraceae bacterium]
MINYEALAVANPVTPFSIFVNQAGYYPDAVKKAYMAFSCEDFEVLDLCGNVKYSGKTVYAGPDETSGDDVWVADFTPLKDSGRYCIRANGNTSAMFNIGRHIYDDVLCKTLKAFYYLRCGQELTEEYALLWHHAKCHTDLSKLWEDADVSMDATGGWHDAGDYGKYVTAGSVACAQLLYAYKLFPDVFNTININIPKAKTPDILTEVRYELEWLLKMQNSEGGVYHKVTTKMHAPFIMPEDDHEQMYVFPVSSMACADFAAVCALAATIYEVYDKDFSDKLIAAAKKSAAWLDAHPDFLGFSNPDGCNTGEYGERNDYSNRFWAYCELYSATGESSYHDKLIHASAMDFPLTEFGYSEIGALGAVSYMLCKYTRDPSMEDKIRGAFNWRINDLKNTAATCGYDVAMGEHDYYWGSNMGLMTKAMVFAMGDVLFDDHSCVELATSHLHYLLGANALGICYVTGVGEFRVNNPHLRPTVCDGIGESIPGMVAGGPNRNLSDPIAKNLLREGTPPMKCYADNALSYSLNEITIYWNSPAVFVLAYLLNHNIT